MVGLGFAMTENIQYYGRAVTQAGGGADSGFILRGALAPSHPMFTSLTGIGLGLARQSRNALVRHCACLWPVAAISMHAIWNGSPLCLAA